MAIARFAQNEDINVNYDKTKKLANCSSYNYLYCRKSIKILINNNKCINI